MSIWASQFTITDAHETDGYEPTSDRACVDIATAYGAGWPVRLCFFVVSGPDAPDTVLIDRKHAESLRDFLTNYLEKHP